MDCPHPEEVPSAASPRLPALSVFFPAFNEETNLRVTVERALEILPTVADAYEVLVVDDGSTDATPTVAKEIAAQRPEVRWISHPANRGYGEALKTGFSQTRFEWIAFTDADGQFDFADIHTLLRAQRDTGADLVAGSYLRRAEPFLRRLNSWLWHRAVRTLCGVRARDPNCAFKLLRRRVIETVSPLESTRGAFISTELLVKAQRAGFRIVEVGVHHYPRKAGRSTGSSPSVVLASLADLWRLRKRLKAFR